MKTILTFVIPVRHPENATDWSALKHKLSQTIKSIAAQDAPGWRAVIVANTGSDMPQNLPQNVHIKYVDFPPNQIFERGENDVSVFHDAVRLDKGRRVLSGMDAFRDTDYFMVVDDDDFINAGLTSYVQAHAGENGWYISEGYIWTDGGKWLYKYDDFDHFCGTCLIVRSDLYRLPDNIEDCNEDYIKKFLGSHTFLRPHMESQMSPLKKLPFTGAVYRIGYSGSHSKSQNIFRHFFLKKYVFTRPWLLLKRVFLLRPLGDDMKKTFWGGV